MTERGGDLTRVAKILMIDTYSILCDKCCKANPLDHNCLFCLFWSKEIIRGSSILNLRAVSGRMRLA